jgi:cysteine-rich repeat protein
MTRASATVWAVMAGVWLVAGAARAAEPRIYWSERGSDRIRSARLDGTDVQNVITTGLSRVTGLAIDEPNGLLYWAERDLGRIERAGLDGGGRTLLATPVGPFAIVVEPVHGHVWWSDAVADVVQRADLDGGSVTTVLSGLSDPYGLAIDVDGDRLYWTDFGTDELRCATLNGAAPQTLLGGLVDPQNLALDPVAGRLYWAEYNESGRILRANLDGSGVETLASGMNGPVGIALDRIGGKIYWTVIDENRILRANLDGSGRETLLSGLSAPEAIAVLRPPECGNGFVERDEGCDDGNTADGDCCSSTCQLDPAGAACTEDGAPCTADACDAAGICRHSAGNPGATCRAAADVCDVPELCDGTSAACPGDAKSTAVCRLAAGVCDLAESCDGSADACPADAKATHVCRPGAGICDLTEACDGAADDCPADLKSTGLCRASVGVCDLAESCDGLGDDCPADAKSNAVCRASTGACDLTDSCDGSADDCPTDGFAPSGTACADPLFCNGAERCDGAGVCAAEGGPCSALAQCDEELDECVAGCAAAPLAGCRAAERSFLALTESARRDRVIWKWLRGAETIAAEFGDLAQSTDFAFCVYADAPGTLVAAYAAPHDLDAWRARGDGWQLRDGDRALSKIDLRAGTAGRARIVLKGKGELHALPSFPLASPLRVQAVNDETGVCWESVFATDAIRTNAAGRLKAVSRP